MATREGVMALLGAADGCWHPNEAAKEAADEQSADEQSAELQAAGSTDTGHSADALQS